MRSSIDTSLFETQAETSASGRASSTSTQHVLSRRMFIKGALAASALSAVGLSSALTTTTALSGAQRRSAITAVIGDIQYPQAVWFMQRLGALGVETHTFSGDITRLWSETLDRAWRAAPTTVAGLTSEATLFGIEQLCTQHHMRIQYRTHEPVRVATGCNVAGDGERSQATGIATHGNGTTQGWVSSATKDILQLHGGGPNPRGSARPFAVPSYASPTSQPNLVAWIIGPVSNS